MSIRQLFTTMTLLLASLPALALADATGSRPTQSVTTDGSVKMTTSVDKATARVAEPVQLTLQVEAPRGARIELPKMENHLGDFEVHHSSRVKDIPSATQTEKRVWELRLTLESIKTGELAIPSLEAHYATDEQSTTFRTLRTSPIAVHITSVLENRADPTRFRDIKQTVDVPVPAPASRGWVVWTSAGVGGVVAALLLIAAVAKRRQRGPTPAAWALASIEELQQLNVSQTDAEKLFNEVLDVVREYFELEFNVPTLSRTTREFLAEASSEVGLPEMAGKRLTWLASVADEVKFAHLGVGEKHVQHAFTQAKAFIAECETHRSATAKGAA